MKIVPYVFYKGEWSLPDEVFLYLWIKIEKQNLVKRTFSDGSVKTSEDFFKMITNQRNMIAVVLNDDNKAIGMGWLNAITVQKANAHFLFLKEAWGKTTFDGARALIEYWFGLEIDGKPLFEVLLGQTPIENKPAINFIKRLGWVILGEIPKLGVLISYRER